LPSICKMMKIIKILGFITLFSAALLQNVNRTFATESVETLLLSGSDVRIIENEILTVNKTITITENATLHVINSKIIINFNANITLTDPKNGNPRLILTNSTLEPNLFTTKKYNIYAYGNSTLTFNSANIAKAEFFLYDSSSVTITNNSKIESSFFPRGNSVLEIYSSNLVKSATYVPKIEASENSNILLKNVKIDIAMYIYGKDRSKISILYSEGQYCEIQAWQYSEVSVSDVTRLLNLKFYDNSKGKLRNVGVIGNVYAYDLSDVELRDTGIFSRARAYGYASLYMSKTNVLFNIDAEKNPPLHDPTDKKGSGLMAMGNAIITVVESTIDITRMFDDTKATFISTIIKDANFYNHSNIYISGTTEKAICNFSDYSCGLLSVKSKGIVDMNVKNFGKIIAQNSARVRLISLTDYAKAYIIDSVLQMLLIKDCTQVSMRNSEITRYLEISDSGLAEIAKSKVLLIELRDLSKIVVSNNSAIQLLTIKDPSEIAVENSEIEEVTIQLSSVRAYFSNILPRKFTTWNIYTDTSLYIYEGGESPHISLNNTKITKGWNFFIEDYSTVEFTNCRLNTFEVCDNSIIKLYNTTTQYQTLKDGSQIQVYWYLDITALNDTIISVADEENQQIDSINVTNNQARFVLFEKSINAAETNTLNKYTVITDYKGQRQQQNIVVTSNIAFDLTQPSWWETNWPTILLPTVIVIGVLLATLIYLRRRRTKPVKSQI